MPRRHKKPAMHISDVPHAVPVLAAVFLLGGCVGVPQTFYSAEPAAPEPRAVIQASPRPAPVPAAAPLSASEKRRLFQDFQQSHDAGSQAATDQLPAP